MTDVAQLNREQFVEKLLQERYFIEDDGSWSNLIKRVVKHGTAKKHKDYAAKFYDVIINKDFLPSRMPYMGTERPFSSSCFVFDMEDNWESIFDCLRDAVAVQRYGGGTGYNFSTLRPEGDLISTTKGKASGPLSFMQWFQDTFQCLKRAGRKMAAQMAILNIDHPDIEQFIDSKTSEGSLWCFNISVAVTDKFMEAVKNDLDWDLVWNGEVRKTLKARYLYNKIVTNAHHMAEPGIIFQDEVDRKNKFDKPVRATNPCLSGDTLITTDNGIFELSELVGKTFRVQGMNGNWYNSTAIKTSNSELLYKITLENGQVIKATANHIFPVSKYRHVFEDKQVSNIIIGDKLKANTLTQEKPLLNVDYDEGFLAGWILGDGWVSKRKNGNLRLGMICSQEDKDNGCLEKIDNITNKLFTKSTAIFLPRKRRDTYGFNNGNSQTTYTKEIATQSEVIEWLQNISFDITKNNLPKSTYNNYNFAWGLIDGLFSSDGYVDKNYIAIEQSRHELLINLQKLLWQLGIRTSLSNRVRYDERTEKTYSSSTLSISKGACGNIPIELTHIDKNSKLQKLNSERKQNTGYKITNIESYQNEPVYDIQMDSHHYFPIGSVFTHNCGEQSLVDRSSCNLGAVNLAQHVTDEGEILWNKLEETTRLAIRFLDGSLANAWFPVQAIRDNSDKYRNIGLSIMGWHDFLLMLDIPYASEDALDIAEQVMGYIQRICDDESKQIGFEETGERKQVNTTLTTIQPTGSLSVLAGCSSAIEPFYAPIENRFSYVGTYSDMYTAIERKCNYEDWNTELIKQWAIENETLLDCPYIPEESRKLFACTNEIDSDWHVKTQAVFQSVVCQAVSKTINLPNDATPKDIWDIYFQAWETKCKSITVYRQGSRDVEILSTKQKDDSYFCPTCLEHSKERVMLVRDGGCSKCLKCDYSVCTI